MSLTDLVSKKLDEYGLKIYEHYQIENSNEFTFYLKEGILFVDNEKETINISFQVTTKPDMAAKITLVLNEVSCKRIAIMDSFIFNNKNEYITGNEAYNLVEKVKQQKIEKEVQQEYIYTEILANSRCIEC